LSSFPQLWITLWKERKTLGGFRQALSHQFEWTWQRSIRISVARNWKYWKAKVLLILCFARNRRG